MYGRVRGFGYNAAGDTRISIATASAIKPRGASQRKGASQSTAGGIKNERTCMPILVGTSTKWYKTAVQHSTKLRQLYFFSCAVIGILTTSLHYRHHESML